MKRVLLFMCALFVCAGVYAQKPLTYTDVVKVDSTTTKKELYNRAKLWFANAFRDSNKVLQVEDEQNGQLVGKGSMPYSTRVFGGQGEVNGSIRYTVGIYVKDSRYKYEIKDFTHEATALNVPYSFGVITDGDAPIVTTKSYETKWRDKIWVEIKNQITPNAQFLESSIKESMNKPAAVESDNW